MIVLTSIIVLFALISQTYLRWKYRKFFKLSNILKHDLTSVPFFGISYKFFGNEENRMKQMFIVGQEALKQNNAIAGWFGVCPGVVIADPIQADFLLKKCLDKHSLVQRLFSKLFGTGSLSSPVHIWRPRRKIVLPIFNSKNTRQFKIVFSNHSAVLVNKLKAVTGKPIPIFEYFAKYALDSVCETTMGIQLNSQLNSEENHFELSVDYVTRAVSSRLVQPWLWIDCIYKRLSTCYKFIKHRTHVLEFIEEIIKEKKKQMQEKDYSKKELHIKVKSTLELMMEASDKGQKLTDTEMLEETMITVMAGSDTTAAAAAFTTLMLIRHPEVQAKIHEELKRELNKETPVVMPEDLRNLKYLEATIKETLRLYPPIVALLRETNTDVTLPSGETIPEKCGILVHLWAINRNPSYWGPDAEEFRPERFLDGSAKHPAQFITFSIGPRNCIGSQYAMFSIKTVLANVLQRYKVLPVDETAVKKPIRLVFGMIMKDADNFMVRLEPKD